MLAAPGDLVVTAIAFRDATEFLENESLVIAHLVAQRRYLDVVFSQALGQIRPALGAVKVFRPQLVEYRLFQGLRYNRVCLMGIDDGLDPLKTGFRACRVGP